MHDVTRLDFDTEMVDRAALPPVLQQDQLEWRIGDREVGVAVFDLGGRSVEQLGVERDCLVEVVDVEGELNTGHVRAPYLCGLCRTVHSGHDATSLIYVNLLQYQSVPKTLPMIDMSTPVCCAPVAAGPMSDDDALEVALRLKALADPVRVKIMSLLFSSSAGEENSGELAAALGLGESTVSHHLSQLRRAGFVVSDRRGMHVFHRPAIDAFGALCSVLDPTCCA